MRAPQAYMYTHGMGIATTATKLPLATYAKILGLHPLHFEGIQFTPLDRDPKFCQSPLMQYAWQESDRVAREDIAEAIAQAEELIETQLGAHLLPSWDTEEWQKGARPYQPELFGYTGTDIRGFATTVRADWGYVRSGGIEALTLLGASQPINWSDTDGDGLEETGTVVIMGISTAVAECEIEIFYPGHNGEPEYQIRPALVNLTGGTATITFRRELAVIEDMLFEMNDPQGADYTDDADFLDEVDVYRHYNDPSTQVTLMWEPKGCAMCSDLGCLLCSYAVQAGCIHLRGIPKMGMVAVTPGEWDAATNSFNSQGLAVNRTPDVVRLFYYSGIQAKRGCVSVMDPQWARTVAYLATALLDRPFCSCTENVWKMWREDLALLSGGEEQTSTYSFDTRKAAGECPFGTRRGALYAWNRIRDPNIAPVDVAVLV